MKRDMNIRMAIALALTLAATILVTSGSSAWAATTEQVLYSFNPAPDGVQPQAGLIFDAAGNLYGTTSGGGAFNSGTAFELSPAQGGGWTETKLYSFSGGMDGGGPLAGLILDTNGNLYGSTSYGGNINSGCGGGCGVIFELSPAQGGSWTETVLYRFSGSDGQEPHGDVIFDSAGNLYSTTRVGGVHNYGVVFKLTPSTTPPWTETVLHSFAGGTDDSYPTAGLTLDSHGNLFGMTTGGVGSVFKLTHTPTGAWSYKSLFYFGSVGAVGNLPQGKVILDNAGRLYGTTYSGGNTGGGVVFQLTHTSSGWAEAPLYSFAGGADGANPGAGLVRDVNGRLWGTTQRGGNGGAGVIFRLNPTLTGWIEKVFHIFPSYTSDGSIPLAPLIFDSTGKNLYGTTYQGGSAGDGVVFELTP